MHTTPALHHWLWGTLSVVLASVAVGSSQVRRAPSLREHIQPHVASPTHRRPIQAVFVVQKKDCTGNLRMLDLLHRERVRHRITLTLVWYAGPIADSTFIRAALPTWASTVALRPLPRHAYDELQRLGHDATPMLIVLDKFSRIRFATHAPPSGREFAGLGKIIEGLTWIEEL